MQVGDLVRYKAGDFIGFVIETYVNNDLEKMRVRVRWTTHHNQTWWLDQILVELL